MERGCWGYNVYGEATPPAGTFTRSPRWGSRLWFAGRRQRGVWGDDSHGGQSTPPVGTFTQVSLAFEHSCGLQADGSVACWGNNEDGETTPPRARSPGLAGAYHSCGVKADGSVACGDNTYGETTPPAEDVHPGLRCSEHSVGLSLTAAWPAGAKRLRPDGAAGRDVHPGLRWRGLQLWCEGRRQPGLLGVQRQRRGDASGRDVTQISAATSTLWREGRRQRGLLGGRRGSASGRTSPGLRWLQPRLWREGCGSLACWGPMTTAKRRRQQDVHPGLRRSKHTVALSTSGAVLEWGSMARQPL